MTITTQLMTADELMRREGPNRHDMIQGELLTMPPATALHGHVVANLIMLLVLHVRATTLGSVYAETGYKLETHPDRVLGPDVSFVARERIDDVPDGYFP